MFYSLSNLIFILIPLAIFIGRIVVQARNKHEPPPRIPVHFEDDDKAEYFEALAENTSFGYKRDVSDTIRQPVFPPVPALAASKDPSINKAQEINRTPKTPPAVRRNILAPAEQKESVFNLSHLSQMKQAVAMAEILGLPKGLL